MQSNYEKGSNNQKWFEKGYEDMQYNYPAHDYVWGTQNFPKQFKEAYREGQIAAYLDGKAEKPWFYKQK